MLSFELFFERLLYKTCRDSADFLGDVEIEQALVLIAHATDGGSSSMLGRSFSLMLHLYTVFLLIRHLAFDRIFRRPIFLAGLSCGDNFLQIIVFSDVASLQMGAISKNGGVKKMTSSI